MKLIRTAIMAALAKKVYDEARKPHNQQKAKDLLAQLSARAGGRGGPRRG